jgi:hypothetical protein
MFNVPTNTAVPAKVPFVKLKAPLGFTVACPLSVNVWPLMENVCVVTPLDAPKTMPATVALTFSVTV